MNKIFSVFTVIILFGALALAQVPTVDIVITVSDNQGGLKVLNIGLDVAATTGIDPQFGESDLPPFPPAGAFEARWNLQPFGVGTLSTYKDYRNAPAFPFSGQVTHRLNWQYTDLATQLNISYNLPQQARMRITSNNSVPIWSSDTLSGSGTYTLPDPDNEYTAARIFLFYDAIVPVELTSFTAAVTGTTVKLNWTTATEINNRGFDVERSSEGSTQWTKIGFVEGSGTTTNHKQYSYSDKPGTGKYYYRLRQVDFDGTHEYSGIVSAEVTAPTEFKLNQNYPNPFNPSTKFSFTIPVNSDVILTVYNQIGQQVGIIENGNLEAGSYEYTWNAENQSSGIYFYELSAGSFKSVRKMTLVK